MTTDAGEREKVTYTETNKQIERMKRDTHKTCIEPPKCKGLNKI